MTAGSLEPMFTRPLPVLFLLIALALLVWPLYGDWKRSRMVDDTIE
jgi:putative tricarboxylic transport membrane protein